MAILPPLHSTINFVAFMANLIDLKQFNTIMVLHDQANRNQINFLIENLQPCYDVTWMLVTEYDNPEYWHQPIIKHDQILILTALQDGSFESLVMPLYDLRYLNFGSKNIIISSANTKLSIKAFRKSNSQLINAVFIDWMLDKIMIYAWNPNSAAGQVVGLNETEFLRSSRAAVSDGKYSGLFFGQLHSLNGGTTLVSSMYDAKYVYNVISKGSAASIDGAEIRIVDMIGEAIQSPIEYWLSNPSISGMNLNKGQLPDFLERTYRTFAPVPIRNFYFINENSRSFLSRVKETNDLMTVSSNVNPNEDIVKLIYPHGFENSVIIVENNTTSTATAIQRIFTSPVIYLWILLIGIFVVTRCGVQWIFESYAIDIETRRQRCALMCEETVQLSCGVVMTTKLFASHRYGRTALAHGATIVPLVAGMFLSGLLYGDYLIHSQTPNIDSIEELERSNLTVYGQLSPYARYHSRVKNEPIYKTHTDILQMIWSGNTNFAYLIPERWASMVDTEHLRRNGRPLFHVVKERYGVSFLTLRAFQWYLQDRMSSIVMRLHEHGFVKYFAAQQTAGETGSTSLEQNTLVATAGGLQEILVACYIYLVGIVCAIFALGLEYFTKKNSQ